MVFLEEVNSILYNVKYYFIYCSSINITSKVYNSVVERRRINYYSPVVGLLGRYSLPSCSL
jgi:hypothetical protein